MTAISLTDGQLILKLRRERAELIDALRALRSSCDTNECDELHNQIGVRVPDKEYVNAAAKLLARLDREAT